MKEAWKWVPGYEGIYKISNLGHVYSVSRPGSKGGKLKLRSDSDGYQTVILYKNGAPTNKKVHRLVALVFIPNFAGKSQVNHINGNKSDNCFSNLEWATPSENVLHSHRTGLKNQCGEKNPAFKGWIIGTSLLTGEEIRMAGKADIISKGFYQASVSKCVLGQQRVHKGYSFRLEACDGVEA